MRFMSRAAAFWALVGILGALLAAASAPSPLYVVYQARWGFSALTLTLVFAVYVLALLAALLWTGSLSDHTGRRPVLLASLTLQSAAMLLFLVASGVTWLYLARIVQGAATGVATGALSAAIVDFQPGSRPGSAALANAVTPMLGLAAGALGAGLLVEYAPAPLRLVYWVLLIAYVVAIALVVAVPESVARASDRRPRLRPRISVPAAVRPAFVAVAPGLIAVWALSGLYLSLGPSLAGDLSHSTNHLVGGLVIVCLAGAGAAATLLLRALPPHSAIVGGSLTLMMGVGLTIAAIQISSTVLFFVGSVVAGVGFGPAFGGAFRRLTAAAPAGERAGLISAIYIVAYLAFSIPAIVAGIAVTHIGLRDTATVYAAAVLGLAALATVGSAFANRAEGA